MSWMSPFGSVPEETPSTILEQITNPELNAQIQIVDVRTRTEYKGGHVQGAISCSLLPTWSFRKRLEKLELSKEKKVICICLSAHRSILAQKLLTEMGYRAGSDLNEFQVHDEVQMQGGMQKWRSEKLPETTETITQKEESGSENEKEEPPSS